MPPKQKGAVAEDKIEAPPSKRTKGVKVEETQKSSEAEVLENDNNPDVDTAPCDIYCLNCRIANTQDIDELEALICLSGAI